MAGDFCGVAGTPAANRGWGCVKKGSDNVIADYLSRLERTVGTEKEAEIAEIFPDEELLMLSVQTP